MLSIHLLTPSLAPYKICQMLFHYTKPLYLLSPGLHTCLGQPGTAKVAALKTPKKLASLTAIIHSHDFTILIISSRRCDR